MGKESDSLATIFDIAKLAKTSKSTVSRVISDHGYVSAETRSRILDAINELNYIPNQIARQMKYQRTNTIGFLVNDYYPTVGDFINYFVNTAKSYNYRVNIYFTGNPQDELAALNLLMTRSLDGLFLLAKINDWDKIIPYTKFGPIATWRRIESDKIYSSYIDHFPIYMQILEYIYAKGARFVGHILNCEKNSNTQARLEAIQTFEKTHSMNNEWRLFYNEQKDAGIDAAHKWIAAGKAAPKIVVVYSDYVATEFISILKENGYQLPKDCAIFGFDNSNFGRLMNISTVDTFLEKQAINSFYYIYNKLNNTNLQYKKINPKLVFRETC
ncbi:LacI family DNA-binding transcriptional regulator [Pelosinus fermentans]|uniref:LacI family DNA-binding transcriptional regulator n=1 Tax=Pelosinus fermentans TaxID=365349 RepID=UPI0003139F9E|nr:LacI family DNA-binding transcriptional regulator [Pelosinus fermentans]